MNSTAPKPPRLWASAAVLCSTSYNGCGSLGTRWTRIEKSEIRGSKSEIRQKSEVPKGWIFNSDFGLRTWPVIPEARGSRLLLSPCIRQRRGGEQGYGQRHGNQQQHRRIEQKHRRAHRRAAVTRPSLRAPFQHDERRDDSHSDPQPIFKQVIAPLHNRAYQFQVFSA